MGARGLNLETEGEWKSEDDWVGEVTCAVDGWWYRWINPNGVWHSTSVYEGLEMHRAGDTITWMYGTTRRSVWRRRVQRA